MDRSLWLLLGLRTAAWVRRYYRSLRSLKGALLAVVGSLIFMPMVLTSLLAPRVMLAAQTEAIRLYGPLALFGFCLLNVLLSSGDRALYYSPGEVNFLFSGPYRPRQLLLYKAAAGLGAGMLTTPFVLLASRVHATSTLSAFVGLFFGLQFLYLFSIATGLAISTVGAVAFEWGRRIVAVGVIAVVALALWPIGRQALAMPPRELLARIVASPAAAFVLSPFRPFVEAFSAERFWPGLVVWGSVSAGVDLALLGLIMVLNAQFLEASAAASARVYERVKRLRRGEALVARPSKLRFAVPMVPWWGGVGPNLWRQLTTASRSGAKLFAVFALFLVPVVTVLVLAANDPGEASLAGPALSSMIGVALFAPTMVGFDFRPDLGRMEDLKTLPIRPTRLVLGQLVTPVLILSLAEWISLAAVGWVSRSEFWLVGVVSAMALPVNLVIVAVENLYFLWFPFRMIGFNTFDFQAMGRQVLLLMAKMLSVGVAAGLAAGVGYLAYALSAGSWTLALISAWVVVGACGFALLPPLARAFETFDVAEGLPD